ncbi:MAG: cbb3-type cytochrome c oxidase subunit II [Leptospiraceae bacterium]|nr:cbb3-type cytochrome c oxidase subunit II [Leptospiraceae bacterium]
MSTSTSKKPGDCLFTSNTRILIFSIIATVVLSFGIAWLAWLPNTSHGSLALLTPPSPLAMKGQEVYYQEGCQYCHTQSLRNIPADVNRYVDPAQYGLALVADANEYRFESPSLRGSSRIGPDLARIAGSPMDNPDALRSLLRGKAGPISAMYHQYESIFENEDEIIPVFLSWKIRMMMQIRTPFSDNYQKSVFTALDDQSRGDALVEYLLSLGRKQSTLAGKYYSK